MARITSVVLFALIVASGATKDTYARGRGSVGADSARSLLQTYDKQLSGSSASSKSQNTPVTRVVNLLKEMSATLAKEQEEDEELYHKLACWCNNNKYEKTEASDEANQKISDLEATIEMLTAKSKELKEKIKELEEKVAKDKAALAEATAIREKQLKEFHSLELDDISAIENLKAAIVVLGKHFDAAFPQMPLSFLQEPSWAPEHSKLSHSFDEFMLESFPTPERASSHPAPTQGFLQEEHAAKGGWSAVEINTVQGALRRASALLQARNGHKYYPSYNAQSGEILGMLKQLKEELEGDHAEAQKIEAQRAGAFDELRKAKTAEIENGEKMAETKEDELAKCDNDNAEAKEDLEVTKKQLAEDQKFLKNLGKTCDEADANFEARKKSRLEEIQAVAETITILTTGEARDAMDTTFGVSFVQTSESNRIRRAAAAVLRKSARKSNNPAFSMLATSVELDAFTKVKEMIDKMIAQLTTEQADEVKKNDWCISELQENEMTTMKTKDLKADLEAKSAELEATIKTLTEEIEKALMEVNELRVELQRASENRKKENLDFQKVVADQMVTAEVLGKALDKLATFYDEAAFAQMKKQTPPVPQMEYKKSSGASGVMSMIEKLIYETKDITKESKKSEAEAQAGYEALIADTNASILNLMKEITMKKKAKEQAKKDLLMTEEDLNDTIAELENLAKENADLHFECDYLTKNFMIRQKARAEEIEALQQAKQILNGASFS